MTGPLTLLVRLPPRINLAKCRVRASRVWQPGGSAIMSFSNRCFPTKAIAIWGQTDDAGHIWIVGSYFKFSADWADAKALDISADGGDPMFVVQGTK